MMAACDSSTFFKAWLPSSSVKTEFQRPVKAILQTLTENSFIQAYEYWAKLWLTRYVQRGSAGTRLTRDAVKALWNDHEEAFTAEFLALPDRNWSLAHAEPGLWEPSRIIQSTTPGGHSVMRRAISRHHRGSTLLGI